MKKKKGLPLPPLNDPMDLYQDLIEEIIAEFDLVGSESEFYAACESIVWEEKVDTEIFSDDFLSALDEFLNRAEIEEPE